MRQSFNLVAVTLAMLFVSVALAQDPKTDKTEKKDKPLTGKVTAVAADSADSKITDITVTSHGKKGEDPVVTVVKATADTTVTKGKDKEEAKLADVVVGSYVKVTADADKKATAIQIMPPHEKKKDKPATN